MTSYAPSSALSFFYTRTKGGLLLHRPFLVSCSLDPFSSNDVSHLGSCSRDSTRISNRYANHGSCGPTFCNNHGNFSRQVFAAYVNFLGDRNLRKADILAFDGCGELGGDWSFHGHGNRGGDYAITCNSYGSGKSFYREASLMSSRHNNAQRCDRAYSAVDNCCGNIEGSSREPLFESVGNTSSASIHRELPRVSSSNCSYKKFSQVYPVPLDRDCSLVSDRYPSRVALSEVGSHGRASPFQNVTVSVFWDLDNKPPRSSPYHAALYLRKAASQFGSVIDMVAYANHHAFTHVPDWVREERRDRKQLDLLERRGQVRPELPYVCNLCGRKCKTNLLLQKHFKQLHEREHNKRMSRLNSLKGRKRAKFKESVQGKTARYQEAARPILVPKVGYGLESDLRRAGVYVRTVQYKPQAADVALKRQMSESMNKGVKCLCLVSDDTDFAQMLADARALNLRTVVFGESKSLKRFADLWLPWDAISEGLPIHDIHEATSTWRQHQFSIDEQHQNILAGGGSAISDVQHKIFAGRNPVQRTGFSVFSEDECIREHNENADESSSDDDEEFAFDVDDDVDDELDGDWEDGFDTGVD